MSRIRVVLDHASIRDLLRSDEFRYAVREAADEIATHVRAQRPDVEVVVDSGVGENRAWAGVTIRDVRARAIQARHRVFDRAAIAAGLEVRMDDRSRVRRPRG